MARIKGVDIPNEKRVEIALTYIYGIGRSLSNKILEEAKVDPNKRAKDLTNEEVSANRNARTRKGKGKVVANKKK